MLVPALEADVPEPPERVAVSAAGSLPQETPQGRGLVTPLRLKGSISAGARG